jgi:hypothetical protein
MTDRERMIESEQQNHMDRGEFVTTQTLPSAPRLRPKDRIVQWIGRCKKWTLRRLESLAYDVVGWPLALRRLGREPQSSPAQAPAAYLHEVYGKIYWRLPGGLFRGLAVPFLWPVGLIVTITLFTRRNGAAIHGRTGKSVARQVAEQVQFAARHAIAPYWYYMFELYDDERQKLAPLYLTAHETIGPAYSLLQPPPGTDAMADKVWFAQYCRKSGVAAVPVLFLLSGGQIIPTEEGISTLPDADMFVKPRVGNGGHNSERWDFIGDGRYRSSTGQVLGREELTRQLALQSLKGDYVVQPRLANHPVLDDISNGALATVRVLTCRNEGGGFEATDAAFRMAIGGNTVIDNFHAGGIATKVDLKTGEIGAASDMGLRPQVGWRDSHPVSGVLFRGRTLPMWKDVVDLACRAHAAFPQRIIVGWDVAMLAEGTCIIEGNIKPDLDIHQRVERRPLGDRRIATLLAFHLWNVLRRE